MENQIEIIKTYTTSHGIVGAVYSYMGRKCSTFLGRVADALGALKKALNIAPTGRALNITEREQTGGRVPEAHNGKFRLKFTDRASRRLWIPAAGTALTIGGVDYIVEGEGEEWTSGKYKSCYLYLTADVSPAPAAEAPIKPESLATDKQVAYAIRLGATDASYMYDAHVAGYVFTRSELAAMTRSEISELICELTAA